MHEFLTFNKISSKNYILIDKMCNVKYFNKNINYDVIIPFSFVNDIGLVNNTYVHLRELIYSINISSITYYNRYKENNIIKIGLEEKIRITCKK